MGAETLRGFLVWLASTAGVFAALSFCLEYLPVPNTQFAKLTNTGKRLVLFALSFGIPLLAYGGLLLLGQPFTPDGLFSAVTAGFFCYTGSQAAFTFIRVRQDKAKSGE